MKTRFESLGVYLPNTILTTADINKRCIKRPPWDLEKITGVHERRIAEKESAYDLALAAARRALRTSRYKAEDLDLIICTSISRYDHSNQYTYEPCQSAFLKAELGAARAQHFDIVNACAGMFTGINVVDNMLRAGAIRTALVVSGEMITYHQASAFRHIQDDLNGQFASLTLGDAGAAVVLDASDSDKYGLHYIKIATGAKWSDLCIAGPSQYEPGGSMDTKPMALQQVTLDYALPFYKDAVEKTGWEIDDVDVFIPHQTSDHSIQKFKSLAQKTFHQQFRTTVISNVSKYGNTASTSHFVALHENFMNGSIRPEQKIQFGIAASGFEIGMATYTMDDLPIRYQDFMRKGEIA